MSENDTELFDRSVLRMRRARVADKMAQTDFLLRTVATELGERITMIKRDFAVALDLGSHTGLLAQAMSEIPTVGQVVRADPAAALLRHSPYPAVVCEEDALPFGPESLDLIAAPLSMHLVNDLPGALIQIARALKPDGLFITAVLSGSSLGELRQSLLQAESELTGGAGARIAPFIDVRDMGGLLQRAGLALPVSDVDRLNVTYADMFALMHDLRAMGMTNMLRARSRVPLPRGVFLRAAQIYREQFSDKTGRVRATFEIVYAAGWKPHESQQKPLRPGSATRRMADVLGVSEQVLKPR